MYKRITNIADKIKDARLKIDEWRVLFAVDNNSDAQKIADFIELSIEKVKVALDQLVEEGFISSADEAETVEEKPETAPVAEEVTEEVVEEILSGGKEEAVLDDVAEENQESDDLLSEIVEEAVEESPPEEKQEVQAEETKEENVPAEEEISLDAVEPEIAPEEPVEDLEEVILDEEAEEEPLTPVEEETNLDAFLSEEPKVEKKEEEIVLEDDSPAEEPKVEEPKVEEPKVEEKSSKGGKTIMVVDDSIVIRKMVEIALENENFNIETAVSGKEALQKVDAINPDLVILDIMLPDVSGIEILKAIKASKGIPVIMLSGKNSPQDLELAKTQGADDFAPKPFKEEELLEKIKALI